MRQGGAWAVVAQQGWTHEWPSRDSGLTGEPLRFRLPHWQLGGGVKIMLACLKGPSRGVLAS